MRAAPALLAIGLALLAPLADAKSITIHAGTTPGGSLFFRPSDITAKEGERVEIVLVNDDPDTAHDWALLEYGGRDVEVYAPGGQTREVSFTANEAGTFRIVCQVVGHKQRGMEGTLTVEDKLFVPAAGLPALALLAIVALGRRRA